MKKYLFFVVLALFASLCTASAESGTCGENLTWDLTDGVLTISGTGEMTDYSYNNAPWYYKQSSIGKVIINDGVTSIGNHAFDGCSGLTSVTIPNSVTNIGNYAFSYCSRLTSVTIPNSVTSIGNYAFYNCSGLTSVTIPNSVTSIGSVAFSGCSGLTSVTIPNSVASIGSSAFSYCSGLTSVTIPNSVTSIGEYAFYNCSGLTSVTIPNSVTSIGNDAFYNVLNIAYNGTATGSPWGAISVNGYVDGYFVYSDATKTNLLGCLNIEGEVTIPNTVKSIGQNAFRGFSGLTSVTIPNSVTSIGNYAFYGCAGLTSVTIPNSVTSIGKNAFSVCSGLKEVHIEDLAAWCKISFGSDNANPLYYAHNLYLNGSLITDLVIPNGVTSIGNYAFSGFSGLTSVTIPNSVTSIGNYVFSGCSGLTSVTIPNSVTSIGNYVFSGCSGLEYVISLPNTPPTIKSYTFPTGVIIYVNNDALDSYQNATIWKNYNIKGLIDSENTEAPTSAVISMTNKVWSLNGNYIVSCGIKDGEMFSGNTLEYIGLDPNSEYTGVPIVLTSNTSENITVNLSFTTSALELTTQPSKPVSSNTAILLAETNMADIETSCGFEWRRNDQPEDMASNQVLCPVANGLMAGRLKGLKDDVYYKYRAFYKSAAGNMYYGDWQYIFTGDVAVEFDPILYTYEASNVQETQARLRGYALAGSDDFTEQGFEYWADSRALKADSRAYAPQATHENIGERHTVQASGISMAINLLNLDAGTVYRYRTYAKIGTQTLYGAEMSFTTKGEYTPPTYTILFVNYDGSPLLTLSEVEHGTLPVYTGDTPVRDEDAQYTYTFSGWEPEVVAAVADATYTATYTATPKTSGVDNIEMSTAAHRKVIENGNLYIILPDGRKFDANGKKVE